MGLPVGGTEQGAWPHHPPWVKGNGAPPCTSRKPVLGKQTLPCGCGAWMGGRDCLWGDREEWGQGLGSEVLLHRQDCSSQVGVILWR